MLIIILNPLLSVSDKQKESQKFVSGAFSFYMVVPFRPRPSLVGPLPHDYWPAIVSGKFIDFFPFQGSPSFDSVNPAAFAAFSILKIYYAIASLRHLIIIKMPKRTIFLQGNVHEKIKCRILEAVKQGVWQMAISSITFSFSATVDTVLILESNFIQANEILPSGEQYRGPMKLSVVQCLGSNGTNRTIGLKSYVRKFHNSN